MQVWDHFYEWPYNDPGSHVPKSMVSSMIFKIPIREPSYLYNNDDMTGRTVQPCIHKWQILLFCLLLIIII